MTRICVIGGSPRAEAESHRIAEIAARKLGVRLGDGQVDLLSLRDVEVPMWSEEKWVADKSPGGFWADAWPAVSARLTAADGFVIVTPEWHGMASPHLKNLLCCCDARELAFKPGYLISVSAGAGGAYPVSELRMSGYKNTFLHWLPEHLIIRDVKGFRPGEADHRAPEWLEPRMDLGLEILIDMAAAITPIREKLAGNPLLKQGM